MPMPRALKGLRLLSIYQSRTVDLHRISPSTQEDSQWKAIRKKKGELDPSESEEVRHLSTPFWKVLKVSADCQQDLFSKHPSNN